MTDRLDRIEAILEANAAQQARNVESIERNVESIERNVESIERNAEGIETLLGAVSSNEVAIERLSVESAESAQRFEIFRQEAQADREESRRKFDESSQRFEIFRQEAQTDREESRRKFDESSQRFEILRQEAQADREESREKFDEAIARIDAQQEVIQRLLVELIDTNRDAARLRDRVDVLEQAS